MSIHNSGLILATSSKIQPSSLKPRIASGLSPPNSLIIAPLCLNFIDNSPSFMSIADLCLNGSNFCFNLAQLIAFA